MIVSCISVFASLLILCTTAEGTVVPVISTEQGQVSGVVEKAVNDNLFFSYNGIPFAQPPTGKLRFKDPVAAGKWDGVLDGSVKPSPCLQVPFFVTVMGVYLPPEELLGDEDCLYLNVYTPKDMTTKKDYPVMVFIHGGGFYSGGAHEYLPDVLLSKDIVLVVIQYRLGLLGFLSTEDSVIPGNFGLKDQTLALQWIKNNINSFGGDPNRVTIFGESAGGVSVHLQMLVPKSEGLFSGVIMQSGNAFTPWAIRPYPDHKITATKIGEKFGCKLEEGSLQFLNCMQTADASHINAAMQDHFIWFMMPVTTAPRVDGDYLPDHPAELVRQGRYHKVNVMAGIVADEGAVLTRGMYGDRRSLIDELKNNYSKTGPASVSLSPHDHKSIAITDALYNYYLGGVNNLDDQHSEEITEMMSDVFFSISHDLVTQLYGQDKSIQTYRYEFTHRGPMSFGEMFVGDIGKHWVPHCDDLVYLFRGGPMFAPKDGPSHRPKDLEMPDDLYMRNLMTTLWTNFAATGNPTPDSSLLGFQWTPTTSSDDGLIHLDICMSPSMKTDSRAERRKFHTSLPTDLHRILKPNLTSGGTSSPLKVPKPRDEL